MKGRGAGNEFSGWNRHLRSVTGTIFPFWPIAPPVAVPVGLRRFEPPFDNVYMLASIIDREGAWEAGRLGGALGGGGGGVGADADLP